MSGTRVVERLRRSGISIHADETVRAVAQTMESAGIGAVVVVEDGKPIGIITDRDLVRRALAPALPLDARADAVMSSPVATIEADDDPRTAYEAIRKAAVRRLVVVRGGVFVGLLTLDDLLVDLAADLHDLGMTVGVEIDHPGRDAAVPVVRTVGP